MPRALPLLLLSILSLGAGAGELRATEPVRLDNVQSAFEQARHERTISLARKLIETTDTSIEHRMGAQALLASTLVVVGGFLQSEREFRALLRVRPDDALADPKIVAVFRKVQAEEHELRSFAAVGGLSARFVYDSRPPKPSPGDVLPFP